jgi:hypothetical protein
VRFRRDKCIFAMFIPLSLLKAERIKGIREINKIKRIG